jgi:uncharacterized protein YaiL (DUF2058 family)
MRLKSKLQFLVLYTMTTIQGTIGDIISNMTQGNMTAVIDVDTLTKNIKERHPS